MATSSRNNDTSRRRAGAKASARFESMPGGLAGSSRKPSTGSSAKGQPIHWEKEARKLSSSLPKDAPVYDSRGVKAGSNRRSTGAVRASSRDSKERDPRRRTGTLSSDGRGSRKSGGAKSSAAGKPHENRAAAFVMSHTRLVLVLVAIVAVGALIYPAARDYYISTRNLEKANIELAEVSNRNKEIQSDIDYLSTDAGKEDYVREQYGWVKAGENPVIVKGIPTETSSTAIEAGTESKTTKPESSWGNKLLDIIFFVGD